jgi:hypothetical protein
MDLAGNLQHITTQSLLPEVGIVSMSEIKSTSKNENNNISIMNAAATTHQQHEACITTQIMAS